MDYLVHLVLVLFIHVITVSGVSVYLLDCFHFHMN